MLKHYKYLLIFLFPIISYSQESKFDFRFGFRIRATPIYLSGYSPIIINPDPPVLIQQDPHLSGLSIFLGISYKINSSISAYYLISGRYDQFYTQESNLKKQFFIDHSLGLSLNTYRKKRKSLSIGVGITFANKNSEFSYKRAFSDQSGNIFYSINTTDLNFTTIDLPIEYRFNDFAINLTPSISIKEKFAEDSQFLLLCFNVSYKFNLKKRI